MPLTASRRPLSGVLAALLGAVLVATTVAAVPAATASSTTTQAAAAALPASVTADSLPAPQIDGNGIVWAQAVVAGKVWAGGRFTKARPSGAAPGTQEVNRNNLLSYDLRTGQLSSFSATFNGQVLGLTGSPDGSRVYVVGEFTSVNGQNRYRVAAFNTATGQLDSSFRPAADFRVRTVIATAGTVYLGGQFGSMNSTPRLRLAAVRASDGALLPWAPTADDGQVMAITFTPDKSKIVVGGFFTTINRQPWYGMGAVDAVTGVNRPWQATSVVRNAGAYAAIYSLSSDDTQVYGTGYHFGTGGNLEHSFAADGSTGQLAWVNGCRGDTYSGVPIGDVFYTVGHPHNCWPMGAFPEFSPKRYQFAMATTTHRGAGNKINVGGQIPNTPAPDVLPWLPTLDTGLVSGSDQAAWSVTGTDEYVLLGGEFQRVNNQRQQGLARFAVSSIAPDREPPQGQPEASPTVTAVGPGALRASWTSMWDRDDPVLRWELLRGAPGSTAGASQVVASGQTPAAWWDRPTMGHVDLTATAGQSYAYRVRYTDPDGNFYTTPGVTATVPAGTSTATAYTNAVQQDRPSAWWRLGETSGTASRSWTGADDLTLAGDVVRNVPGAVAGSTASQFSGTGPVPAASTVRTNGPTTFTAEAWIRTTTTRGGKIVGFGNSRTGGSTSYDRHVYMINDGRLVFGMRPGAVRTVMSTGRFNDGQWHHVVATAGGAGVMTLMVDGLVVGQQADVHGGLGYFGYWRVGGDTVGGWPSSPSSTALAGTIDEVAIYPTVLPLQRVRAHYEASGRTGSWANTPPTAAFTAAVSSLAVTVDGAGSTDPDGTVASYAWNFGDGVTATGRTASHTYGAAGTYTVRLTVTDDDGATSTTTRSVVATASTDPAFARDAFQRSVTAGWGTADRGGPWSVSGQAGSASVTAGTGRLTASAGRTTQSWLTDLRAPSTDLTTTVTTATTATGGVTFVCVIGRRVDGVGDYRVKLRQNTDGTASASVVRLVGTTETALRGVNLPGTWTGGTTLQVRLQVFDPGTGTGTTVRTKVWRAGTAEPTAWTVSATDTTAALQGAGSVGALVYASSAATVPAVASFDDLVARPVTAP